MQNQESYKGTGIGGKLSKIHLCAWELKYNRKTEFGIKSNNSFIALRGKGGCSRLWPSKTLACQEEGAGEFYRDIQDLASLDRGCLCGQPG